MATLRVLSTLARELEGRSFALGAEGASLGRDGANRSHYPETSFSAFAGQFGSMTGIFGELNFVSTLRNMLRNQVRNIYLTLRTGFRIQNK